MTTLVWRAAEHRRHQTHRRALSLFLTAFALVTPLIWPVPIRAASDLTFQFSGATSKAEAAFRQEMAEARERVRDWWGPTYEGPIAVEVTRSQVLSMALVPAWRGERGHMIFGTKRVNAGEAAGIHEMIHVFAPNANRFLAEGIAVYGHQLLNGHAAYPNFGKDLNAVAAGVAKKDLVLKLERIATPEPLESVTRDGEAIAGSFVGHLVKKYGMDRFKALYALTPLQVHQRDAGPADRWQAIYGSAFADLVDEWLGSLPR